MDPYIGLLSKNKSIMYSSIKDISVDELIRNLIILDERSKTLEHRELIYDVIKSKTDNKYKLTTSCYLLDLMEHMRNIDNSDYKTSLMYLWRNGELQ